MSLSRKTPLRRTTRLKPVSPRRASKNRQYITQRKSFLAAQPTCERCHTARSCDVHHSAGRTQGGFLDLTTWRAVCRTCHDFIHQHPKEARAQGWLK